MERIVLYDRARPCTSREVVLGDELTCRLNQNLDDFERATRDRDRYSMRSQFTPSEIELPLARPVYQLSTLWPLFRISHVLSEIYGVQKSFDSG
jgi:hypothetical protein